MFSARLFYMDFVVPALHSYSESLCVFSHSSPSSSAIALINFFLALSSVINVVVK